MKKLLFLLSIIMLCWSLPTAGFSHRVTVFAYAQGDIIIGEALFSGGRPAKGAKITVENAADGSSYLTTVTDEQGMFSFPIPEEARRVQADLRIVLLAGEAHRNEYVLKADEYLPTGSAGQPGAKETSAETADIAIKNEQPGGAEEAFIRQLVKDTVAEELAPIKLRLRDQANQGPTLRDIIGGIGFIFGLAGIIAYYRSRKRRNS